MTLRRRVSDNNMGAVGRLVARVTVDTAAENPRKLLFAWSRRYT